MPPPSHSGLRSADPFAALPPTGRTFLHELTVSRLIDTSDLTPFLAKYGERLAQLGHDRNLLGQALVRAGLMTHYQLSRVLAGTAHGLVLGGYRILQRLGSGSIGIVFRGEHIMLKRQAAIKVLPVDDSVPAAIVERFFGEMRVLASLQHPHIIAAHDAGRLDPPLGQQGQPSLLYLVLELVTGGDLEQRIIDNGPAAIPQACEWIRQAAAGLQAAHDRHLIHRDLKPSNMLLTGDGVVKLVDFGLVRQFASDLTDPNALLGSLEFMPPEQSVDPSAVDGRADIYALGATLFYALTGEPPYPIERNVAKAVRNLQTDPPRRLREIAPDMPEALDVLLARMLARDPADRPSQPVQVMRTLARFTTPEAPPWEVDGWVEESMPATMAQLPPPAIPDTAWRVLLAMNDGPLRSDIGRRLRGLGCVVAAASDLPTALAALNAEPFGLALFDAALPEGGGIEALHLLRNQPPRPHLKLMVRGLPEDDIAAAIHFGADHAVTDGLDAGTLAAKAQSLLHLKDAQDRADLLARHLLVINGQLQSSLKSRDSELKTAYSGILYAMARLAESRDGETAGHLKRIALYCVALAEDLHKHHPWNLYVDDAFLDGLELCAPLHDIGKLGLPDAVLLKAGALDAKERLAMQQHPALGSAVLDSIGQECGAGLRYLGMARTIVRHHHERFDGTGYPDKLSGDAIPPAARLVAVADVYDALRRKRSHKAAHSHAQAVRWIVNESEGAFDPMVREAFGRVQEQFGRVYLEVVE